MSDVPEFPSPLSPEPKEDDLILSFLGVKYQIYQRGYLVTHSDCFCFETNTKRLRVGLKVY